MQPVQSLGAAAAVKLKDGRVEQTFCLVWPVPGLPNVSPTITRILHTTASRSVNNCCIITTVLYVGYIGFEKKFVISEIKGVFQIIVSPCTTFYRSGGFVERKEHYADRSRRRVFSLCQVSSQDYLF